MSYQLAENIFPVGIHSPTWALRADDPSRSRRVRVPRCALPSCLLCARRGDLVSAQDTLDEASDTPRSWGRWLLLAQAARFTAMGGYSSVRAWASTLGEAAGQSGLRSRPGDTLPRRR